MIQETPIQTHAQALHSLHTIHYNIKALAHIAMFISIGSKDFQVEEQELWFLYETLEQLAKQTQSVEYYLKKQRQDN